MKTRLDEIPALIAQARLKWQNDRNDPFRPCAFCYEAVKFKPYGDLCAICLCDPAICDKVGRLGVIAQYHPPGRWYFEIGKLPEVQRQILELLDAMEAELP